MLVLHSNGDLCGELYKATQSRPSENMSAEDVRLLSRTKSGEQKSRLSCTVRGSRWSMFNTSCRLMGWNDVGLDEFSGGLQKERPLIFQSDWSRQQRGVSRRRSHDVPWR